MVLSRARRARHPQLIGVIAVISMTLMLLAACVGGSSPDAATTDVRPPATRPPALLSDRGVGPVALGYVAGGVSYLLLDSGEQYLVPGDLRCCGLASLSPQGRWLLNGDTLYDTGNGSATTVALAAADPQTGELVREVDVDLSSVLRGEESIGGRLGLHPTRAGGCRRPFMTRASCSFTGMTATVPRWLS